MGKKVKFCGMELELKKPEDNEDGESFDDPCEPDLPDPPPSIDPTNGRYVKYLSIQQGDHFIIHTNYTQGKAEFRGTYEGDTTLFGKPCIVIKEGTTAEFFIPVEMIMIAERLMK